MRKAFLFGGVASISLLVLGMAAGCAGEATPNAQPTSYAECLQQQGIDTSAIAGPGAGRPTGFPSGFPRPEGSAVPTGFPGGFPSGRPGGAGFPGGGGLGNQAPAGVDQAKWQAAMEACTSLRPTGFPGQPGGGANGAEAAYRNCLSNRGVTLTSDLATADPAVAEAMAACEPLRPAGQ